MFPGFVWYILSEKAFFKSAILMKRKCGGRCLRGAALESENIMTQLNYPDAGMAECIRRQSEKTPEAFAYEFMGSRVRFRRFWQQVEECAAALQAFGIRENECVTLCLPNIPQAVILLYAINAVGGLANMVHPMAGELEITESVRIGQSRLLVGVDRFADKLLRVSEGTTVTKVLLAAPTDYVPGWKRMAATVAGKIPKAPDDPRILRWKDFLASAGREFTMTKRTASDGAAVLYSGGTTGKRKGILLTNGNLNALALQTVTAGDCVKPGYRMLAVMPIFHGFGLGVCIHTALMAGCECILIPQFSVSSYAAQLKKYQPNVIAGVPTLFEALLRAKKMQKVKLECLAGIFCGGDSLSEELKTKVDAFLLAHGAKEQIREGYGTTECVTASCLTPRYDYRKGSIGLPFPDMRYRIVKVGTDEEVPPMTEGEICLSGPTVMAGYYHEPEETAKVLHADPDGTVWLHTGDLGKMDEDGFVYFVQRLKRLIICSGYNVYPSQVENALNAHEAVLNSCVIGVPDDFRVQVPYAYLMLRPGYEESEELLADIRENCRKYIAKYALPRGFEVREELPKTLVGKVAYRELEEEYRRTHGLS